MRNLPLILLLACVLIAGCQGKAWNTFDGDTKITVPVGDGEQITLEKKARNRGGMETPANPSGPSSFNHGMDGLVASISSVWKPEESKPGVLALRVIGALTVLGSIVLMVKVKGQWLLGAAGILAGFSIIAAPEALGTLKWLPIIGVLAALGISGVWIWLRVNREAKEQKVSPGLAKEIQKGLEAGGPGAEHIRAVGAMLRTTVPAVDKAFKQADAQ